MRPAGDLRDDERGERVAHPLDVLGGGLAVVDQERDLQRVGGGDDPQDFARGVVLADGEDPPAGAS